LVLEVALEFKLELRLWLWEEMLFERDCA